MEFLTHTRVTAAGTAALLTLLTVGCATKKYVRNTVAPLETRVGEVNKKVDTNQAQVQNQITELDQKTERGISDAQQKADQAAQAAQNADKHAQDAQALAQKGVDMGNQLEKDIASIDNYQPVKSVSVLFGLGKSVLTQKDKQDLDDLAQSLGNVKHYVVEVEGFTDKTGSTTYNLELSRRRADAVVRYLTEAHNIPLVKIYTEGFGKDNPAAPNNTRQGRKLNRRVDVKVLAANIGDQQAQLNETQQPSSSSTSTPSSYGSSSSTPATAETATQK